jgi:hypothetical protein
MNAKKLAEWIREEQEKISGITRQLLEKISVVPRTGHDRWLADVRTLFEHYRAHTIRHIALEEQDGYLSPVTEARPFLSKEVDRLHHEHQEMVRLIENVHRMSAFTDDTGEKD